MPPVSADGIIDWLARPFAIDRSTRAWRSVRGTGLGRKPGSGRPVAFRLTNCPIYLTPRHQAATRIPECLKYTPKLGLRRHAHGSICAQEGQPRNSLIFRNILPRCTRAGLEPAPGGSPHKIRLAWFSADLRQMGFVTLAKIRANRPDAAATVI
jgi:hypothetical protein